MQTKYNEQRQQMYEEVKSTFPNADKHLPTFEKWLEGQSNIYVLLYSQFTNSVKEAFVKKRGGKGRQPAPTNIPSAGAPVSRGVMDTADQEIYSDFGD